MTTLDRMLKHLEDAAGAVGREIESSGVGPAVRRGTDASMKVMDRAFDNVDTVMAKTIVTAKDLAARATADEKGTLNKVGKGLMEVRDELQAKRMEWTGGWGETEARRALETTRVGVDRAIQTVRKELNK
jgi:hypothetical protein